MQAITRRHILIISGTASLSALSGCSLFDLTPTAKGSQDRTAEALPMVNALRNKNGLSTLGYNRAAANAAADQAARMAAHGKMEHNIGLGANFLKRMKGMDVPLPAAENIAMGQDSVERAVTAWINSHKHLVNMLGDYSGLGVAVAHNAASNNKPYWAMVLSG